MRKMFPGCGAGDGMPHGSDQTDLSDYIVILDAGGKKELRKTYRS